MTYRLISTVMIFQLFAVHGAANGETIEVCTTCPQTSIRDAIDDANDGDVIQLAAETYYESGRIDTRNKAVTILGAVAADGSPLSFIDGSGSRGVFKITRGEGPDTRLENLVIQNGSRDEGAGVEIDGDSSPTFVNCIFQDNEGANGAGVYVNSAGATFMSCTFTRNDADDKGGALHLNSAESGVLLENCCILDNDAKIGAGIWCNSADLRLYGCTITTNDADDEGGGIYTNSTDLDLQNTIVCGNDSDQIQGDWDDEGGNCVDDACMGCDFDRDDDGVVDCEDGCVDDPFKTEPGACGCGTLETDADGDDIPDCIDDCPDDPDNDADGDGSCEDLPPCFADLDGNRIVDGKDLMILLAAWNTDDATADLDEDGEVGPIDLAYLLGAWGVCP